MSGFLQRLAAQAAGTAPVVHPRAALPYGAPPVLRRVNEAGMPSASPESGASIEAVGFGLERPAAARAAEMAAREAPGPRRSDEVYEPPPAPRAPDRRLFEPVVPRRDATHDRSLPTAVDRPAAAGGLQGRPARGGARRDEAAGSEPRSEARLRSATARALSFESLLPPAVALPRLAVVPHPSLGEPARVPGSSDDTPHEVHVSIGSIEVTAVHEAPAPRPRRAPRPQPMSLADYLARRERPR